jgi:hypothetical protein
MPAELLIVKDRKFASFSERALKLFNAPMDLFQLAVLVGLQGRACFGGGCAARWLHQRG